MKRSFAWSRKGERAAVVAPKTRSKSTTILGATSPKVIINSRVQRSRVTAAPKNQKPNGSNKKANNSRTGTVTGHYFSFIASTLDILDKNEQFKNSHLVMDNAPNHTNDDIQKYTEKRGYGYIYLPSYSPELNPIEQFWSVCKSKLKREELFSEETLTLRTGISCNSILLSDLEGFCRYSRSKFEDCLKSLPL
ncbi:hypothetical protein MFLAVUS_008180 [Mucor flavus]|uniref:Tc1-like transposase DDE domain-containing protein n=1 Tax=Mucor flavus TaxID=439312 RepID=A0ABP9Z6I9_9FUNG